jgi:hypothetical protein
MVTLNQLLLYERNYCDGGAAAVLSLWLSPTPSLDWNDFPAFEVFPDLQSQRSHGRSFSSISPLSGEYRHSEWSAETDMSTKDNCESETN